MWQMYFAAGRAACALSSERRSAECAVPLLCMADLRWGVSPPIHCLYLRFAVLLVTKGT